MHKFTEEQIEFIREIAPGRYSAEITEMVNNRFNLELKVSQIKTCKENHKIRSGLDCRFQKGMIPANKGKKGFMSPEQYEKCKATMFKKGQVPQNHKPVGSERIYRYGYVLVKVAEPNKWRPKHKDIEGLKQYIEKAEADANNCHILSKNETAEYIDTLTKELN